MFSSPNLFGIEDAKFQKLTRWRASTFFVMLIGYIGYYLVRQNLSVALPLMSLDLGYSNEKLGLLAALGEGAYALGKFINGPVGDKIGGKKIFLLGLLGAILCNFFFAASNSYLSLVLVWCACRYFLSMGWGGLAQVIGKWFEPEKNGTVMGWISINFQFGAVIAGALAGWVVQSGGSWRDCFTIPAVLASLVLIYSYYGSKDSPQSVVPETKFGQSTMGIRSVADSQATGDLAARSAMDTVKHLLSLPLFQNLLTYSFFMHMLRSVFLLWTPKLLIDLGLGMSKGIFMSLLFPLLGCFGTILLGWYTDKHAKNGDRARLMWIMLVGLSLCLILMTTLLTGNRLPEDRVTLFVVLLGMAGFFLYGPYSMSAGSLTLDIAGPKAAGTSAGLIDGVGYIGGALASWGAGVLSDRVGWSEVLLILAAFGVLSTLSAYQMSRLFQRAARLRIVDAQA